MDKEMMDEYESPQVLVSYTKEELEEAIEPHGDYDQPGCGCGCGS